uniref:Solute carrier family 29 member 2 n=1 Tax=Neogobius melanostomus TaxID=47308 RepID=A0A8C6TG88_9GOBI
MMHFLFLPYCPSLTSFSLIPNFTIVVAGNADSSSAALGYFITPCVATFATLFFYLLLPHLDFARFYMSRSVDYETERSKELLDGSGRFDHTLYHRLLKRIDNSSSLLPVYHNDHVRGGNHGGFTDSSSPALTKHVPNKGIRIWMMALCVSCVFAVTLSVFPVITVRVQTVYKDNEAWVFTCVCCFIVFNVMDLVGRSTPSLVQWPRKQSRLFPAAVFSRVVFVPLLMMCNVPNSKVHVLFSHDAGFVLLMALFSFTNGYLASLCMAYAPQLVRGKDAETAGSLMTFFLVLGLAVGAALSFALGSIV